MFKLLLLLILFTRCLANSWHGHAYNQQGNQYNQQGHQYNQQGGNAYNNQQGYQQQPVQVAYQQQQQQHQQQQYHHHQQQQQQQYQQQQNYGQANQVTRGIPMSQNKDTQLMNFNAYNQGQHPFHEIFHSIDKLTREQVTNFAYECLSKVTRINDQCASRSQAQTAINTIFEETSTTIIEGNTRNSLLKSFIDKITVSTFNIRNLTIIIALVYLDKASQKLLIFPNSSNVRKLFGGCLMISSKLHTNELSREEIAELMNIGVQELLASEATLTQAITDLTVHPQVLINYVKPLLGTKIFEGSNQNN